ncbi:long-chain-fatty-acid--CoA ligase [bacterium BMS3Abin02]|nr:long-chain-fatty-acid--CoA ligase [bacterium BMS3Abin02]
MITTERDIEAIEAVPIEERNLAGSTYEMLARGAAIDPDATALQFFLQGSMYEHSVTWTYREFLDTITRTANLFHELGVRSDDVVSMILPNLPEGFFTILGAEAAGIVNPINPLLEPAAMADIMNAAATKVLVTPAPFPNVPIWDRVATIIDAVPTLESIVQVDLASYLPPEQRQAISRMRSEAPGISLPVIDYAEALRAQPADRLVGGRVIYPDDIASMFHTGGTTGTPKLALHTHANEVADTWQSAEILDIVPDTVMLCGLPLYHVNGVTVTGLIPWSKGASTVLAAAEGYRDADLLPNFWKVVEHYRVNFFSGVPTVYAGLLRVPVADHDISSLQFAICGAAPMPVEVFRTFEERTGLRILEGYGLTEGTCVSSVNPAGGERRIGSIGFRIPYQEMKIVVLDDEDRYVRCCLTGEVGVVIIRGPNVMPGYKNDEHNRTAWVDTGDGGGPWFNTGDLGRQDADGYFWLAGRKKELIIRGGHNIDPKLIEGPLHRHPAVALAAAVGRPDRRVGEIPVAYVQLKPGAQATSDELLKFAREHVGERAAVPKEIRIVDCIPLTAVGKIFKPELAQREIADEFRNVVAGIDGVRSVEVIARSDARYGVVAEISVTCVTGSDPDEVRNTIAAALGHYTIRYRIKVSSTHEDRR